MHTSPVAITLEPAALSRVGVRVPLVRAMTLTSLAARLKVPVASAVHRLTGPPLPHTGIAAVKLERHSKLRQQTTGSSQ